MSFTAEQYVEKAEEFMLSMQPEMAERFLRKCIEMHPGHAESMDLLAEVLMDLGRHDEAITILKHSVELHPNDGYAKYMYLGQLLPFPDKVRSIERGMSMLEDEKKRLERAGSFTSGAPGLDREQAEEALAAVKQKLAAGYCSLVEVYMTDGCDENDAEALCERYTAAAIAADGGENFETRITIANLRLCQSQEADARTHLAAAAAMHAAAVAPTDWPHDARLQLAKMLIEIGMIDEAGDVMDCLLGENDTISEVWFVYGTMLALQNEWDSATAALTRSRELAIAEGLAEVSPEVIQTVDEKLAEISNMQQQNTG